MLDAVVIDLDGTIVDCAPRHYACYADLAREHRIATLDAQTYWNMKRARAPWASILDVDAAGLQPDHFADRFAERIELPRYLALDRMYPDAGAALRRIRAVAHAIFLVTMRRDADRLRRQLARLGIASLFDRVIARGTSACGSKSGLAAEALPRVGSRTAWIGDTEDDIMAAREAGALACAVCSGLRERRLLEAERPDLIANSLGTMAALLDT